MIPRPNEANDKQLRGFAVILPFALALLVWLVRRHGEVDLGQWWPLPKAVLMGLLVWAALGVVSPPVIRPLYLLLGWAAWPLGIVLSTVIVALIFYGIVTPIGLALRLSGRDPLALERKERSSLWIEKPLARDRRRYSRMS